MSVERVGPTVVVVFGATGDLMARKIAPALFHLYSKGKLPRRFKVLGFSRRNFDNEQFREHVVRILSGHKDIKRVKKKIEEFKQLFYYQQGFYQELKDFRKLEQSLSELDKEWGRLANKLFYLAVPPQLYRSILKRLPTAGLTKEQSKTEGLARVLVEKPFGKDLTTARKLDELLGSLLDEKQIYRIDHYLAKEMLQSILSFRFSNTLLEESWSNKFVESIEIRVLEELGVEARGGFYDGLGALRDVGQNHLLQMLALVTMDHPGSLDGESIRKMRAKVLETLGLPTERDIREFSFRAQYKGYRKIKGVRAYSQTETYFKVRAKLKAPRWRGVPVVLESGKRVGAPWKEVVVTFKHPKPCLCPPGASEDYKNKVIFRLEPNERIRIHFWSKKPGLEFKVQRQQFDFLLRGGGKGAQYVEEYEKVLLDCIAGDQTAFISTDEVRSMWRFVDPIVDGWQKKWVPLYRYTPNTNEAHVKSKFIEEGAGV